MLKTHKFARKPFYVDAVRVSEANIDEVAIWCDGIVKEDPSGKFIQVKVHRPLTERQTQAYIGDWVLYAGTGYKVYVPKAFDKSFEKVKTLTKEQADAAGIKVPHEKNKKPPTIYKKQKRGPSPKNMPPKRVGNVGAALKEAQEKAAVVREEETPVSSQTDSALMDMTDGVTQPLEAQVEEAKSLVEGTIVEVTITPPRSAADIEADRMIAEVDRLRGK